MTLAREQLIVPLRPPSPKPWCVGLARVCVSQYNWHTGERTSDSTTDFNYDTRLSVLHAAMEVIDVPSLVKACEHAWYNPTLCSVNESVVRLGVVQGNITGTRTQTMMSFSTSSAGGSSSIWMAAAWISNPVKDSSFRVACDIGHARRSKRSS